VSILKDAGSPDCKVDENASFIAARPISSMHAASRLATHQRRVARLETRTRTRLLAAQPDGVRCLITVHSEIPRSRPAGLTTAAEPRMTCVLEEVDVCTVLTRRVGPIGAQV